MESTVRRKDRLRLPDRPGHVPPSCFFESLDFPVSDRKMEAYYVEFPARSEPSVTAILTAWVHAI